MSADNWTTCPRCIALAEAEYATELSAVMTTYGHVPVEEFDAARAALKPVNRTSEDYVTFREDYEFYGAETGEVQATYSGSCTKCGLSASLHTSKRFWPEPGQ